MNSKKIFFIIEFVLAVLVIILALMMLQEKNGNDLSRVSVVVPDSDHTQWTALRYGLKMAAEDLGIDLFVVSTGNTLSAPEQMELIQNEIEHGADAVIVQPAIGEYTEELLKKVESRVPVMLVEYAASKAGEPSLLPVVKPDHYAMGNALAEEILDDYNGNIKGRTIGIVTESLESEAAARCRKGFEDGLKGTGADLSWVVSGLQQENKEKQLKKQHKVNIIAAFDDRSLTAAGKYSAANDLHGAFVYGIGHSTEAAYYLDTGSIECLVVPDEFNIGYQSLTQTAKKLGAYFYEMENQTVSYTVIRRDELFSPKNQEILFTMSQ